jgi:integrase
VWSLKAPSGLQKFALADDHEPANGEAVLDYWQALEKCRSLARTGEGSNDRLATVAEALDAYEIDLKARGGDKRNVSVVRFNLPDRLKSKPVALLTSKELRHWRNSLVEKGLTPATAGRVGRALKAALNLAASDDPRIGNGRAWRDGLQALPEADGARNTILPDATVGEIVRGAYDDDHRFGAFVETLAGTGARESQVLKLTVRDLQDGNPAAPRLMMPSSRKGRNRRVDHKPLPISPGLAAVLRQRASGRAPHDLLFNKIHDLRVRFRAVAKRVGLCDNVTPYALRHSSIVRQLLGGIPVRIVASFHDTSVLMIEKTYSRFIIGDASDAMTRRTLLDFSAPAASDNVVPIAGR